MIEDDIDLEISLKKICSEDRMEYFAKSKMIQVNLKGNTISHAESFGIVDSFAKVRKESSLLVNDGTPSKLTDFTISRLNYEYIKSPKYICVEKNLLEKAFSKAFNNNIPNNNDEGLGDHPLISNLEKNLENLRYEKLLNANTKIMKNKDLIKKLKDNKVRINFPIMYSQISDDNSDYIGVFNDLLNTIESLKKTVDVKIKPSLTNITINNTMTNLENDFGQSGNEKSGRSKKGTASSFKMNKSIAEEEVDDNMKSKIQSLEEHLILLKDEEEKNRKILEQTLLERFSKEIFQLKLKLEEKEVEISNSNKIKSDEKMHELIGLLSQIQELSNDAASNYVDKRLVSSHIIKIFCKSTGSKLKAELMENLALLLQLDSQERKTLGLTNQSKESISQGSNPYSSCREIYEKSVLALCLLRSDAVFS